MSFSRSHSTGASTRFRPDSDHLTAAALLAAKPSSSNIPHISGLKRSATSSNPYQPEVPTCLSLTRQPILLKRAAIALASQSSPVVKSSVCGPCCPLFLSRSLPSAPAHCAHAPPCGSQEQQA